MQDCTPTPEAAAEPLVRDARDFWERGWMPGTGGNLSRRLEGPDAIVISASGRHKGRMSADDFVVCDLAGRPVDENGPAPSAETAIHTAIYERISDAGAVYHVHHLEAVLCSGRDFERRFTRFEDVEMVKALGREGPGGRVNIPIVANSPEMKELGGAVDDELGRSDRGDRGPAIMVRNHGFYTWAPSPDAARRHVEALAWLYEWSWRVR